MCKPIFLLNKRIRFCSEWNLFSCIHPQHVCRVQWLGALQPCPPPLTTPCVQQWLPCSLSQPALHQAEQLAAGSPSPMPGHCVWPETICFCHWSLAALLEVLKPSRSRQELTGMCCFSCSVGCVCQWPTSSEHLTGIVPELLLQFT